MRFSSGQGGVFIITKNIDNIQIVPPFDWKGYKIHTLTEKQRSDIGDTSAACSASDPQTYNSPDLTMASMLAYHKWWKQTVLESWPWLPCDLKTGEMAIGAKGSLWVNMK